MSENFGKKVRALGVIAGVTGLIAAVVMAVLDFKSQQVIEACMWLLVGVVALFLIVPVYAVGEMSDELFETKRKLRMIAEKTVRMEKNAKPSSIDKYSPIGRMAEQETSQGRGIASNGTTMAATRISSSGGYSGSTDVPASRGTIEIPSPQPIGSMTAAFDRSSASVDRIDTETLVTDIPAEPALVKTGEADFYTTTSVDRFKFNRKGNSVTRFISPSMASAISAGGLHTVAVTESGKVIAVGYGTYDQCKVSDWYSIVAVAAGNHHTVGLRSDGTCVATGFSGYGQCDVSSWHNICSIAAGVGHTVGLRSDGTCVAVGDNTYGQCNVSDWADIIAVSAGYNYTVGLHADGTIVAVGANTDGTWGAIRWGSMSAIAAGGLHTVGLRGDGTCVAVGNNANYQCEVSNWKNVRAIAAGNYHTVGLLADGSVIATGYNGYGQCNVSEWKNVVAVAAGRNHTIALTRYGKLLSTGDNTYGQCDTMPFDNIKLVK